MTGGPTWIAWLWWIGGYVVALAGLALLLCAMFRDRSRGRRRCPKCWYDMSAAPAPGLRCSECGYEAKSERKLFKTRRRWRWAFAGMLLFASSVGIVGWHQTRNLDWNTIKPVWLLKSQADRFTPAGTEARKELVRRIRNGLMTSSQLDDLIDHALTIQADPDQNWFAPGRLMGDNWGLIVEEAWLAGRTDERRFSRYLENGFGRIFTVRARARVREGASWPVQFDAGRPLLSGWAVLPAPSRPGFVAFAQLVRVHDAQVVPESMAPFHIGSSWLAGSSRTLQLMCTRAPGTHFMEFEFAFAVAQRQSMQSAARELKNIDDIDSPLARWTARITVPVEIVSSDVPTVKLSADDAMHQAILDAINVDLDAHLIQSGPKSYSGRHGMFMVHPLPVALAFEVFCRWNDSEQRIGSFVARANESEVRNVSFEALRLDPRSLFPDADQVQLILRSSTAPAEETLDMTEVWQGEIVIPDLPIPRTIPSPARE